MSRYTSMRWYRVLNIYLKPNFWKTGQWQLEHLLWKTPKHRVFCSGEGPALCQREKRREEKGEKRLHNFMFLYWRLFLNGKINIIFTALSNEHDWAALFSKIQLCVHGVIMCWLNTVCACSVWGEEEEEDK